MQIHLSNISFGEDRTFRVNSEIELKSIEFQEGSFSILEKSPVALTITDTGNKVLELSGNGSIKVGIPCSRCLSEVEVPIAYDFKRKVDLRQTEEERINDLDESSFLTGTDLDVDRLIYLEVLMAWPMKVLCKEDCKGICPNCGQNLNEGTCSCEDEPKDPRMAAISDIFRKFKEV